MMQNFDGWNKNDEQESEFKDQEAESLKMEIKILDHISRVFGKTTENLEQIKGHYDYIINAANMNTKFLVFNIAFLTVNTIAAFLLWSNS